MKLVLEYTAWLTLLSAMALILYIGSLFVFPTEAIHVNVQPSVVLTPEIHGGEDLVFLFDYCRYTEFPTKISRTVRGPEVYTLPTYETVGEPGCAVLHVRVHMPDDIVPGEYTLVTVNTTQVNKFRDIVTQHRTEKFTIIE